MDRLTNRNIEIPSPRPENADYWRRAHLKLAAYEDAEEQGLLVRLPCKVGDMVYLTIGDKKKTQKATVDMFRIDRMGLEIEAMYNHFGLVCFCGRLGVNVFTTPEEAALAKEG